MFSTSRDMMYRNFRPGIRYGFAALSLITVGLIAYQSLIEVSAHPSIDHFDKLVHLCAYFLLGCVTMPALPRISPLLVCFSIALFGVAIEIAQGVMGIGRSADILDGIANLSGAFLAILAWAAISAIRRSRSPLSQ